MNVGNILITYSLFLRSFVHLQIFGLLSVNGICWYFVGCDQSPLVFVLPVVSIFQK